MDGFKKPYRRPKNIYVRKPGDEDDTLVKLYKQSEFVKDASVPHAKKAKPAATDDLDDDISEFINDTEVADETEVPEKKTVKQARKKAKAKAKRHKTIAKTIGKIILIALFIALFVFALLVIFKPLQTQTETDLSVAEATASDQLYYSPLTGLETSDANAATAAATCIMIENSPEARPQSGLKDAGVIYEAVAEGGITRFMAVYQDAKPQYIGPIRSARMTFVELSRQYQCGYIHHGGATVAIRTLRAGNGYRDLDAGWVEGKYSFRVRERVSPHNVYTNFDAIEQWESEKGFTSSSFNGFARVKPDTSAEVPEEQRDATKVSINFNNNSLYGVRYTYDASTNKYLRYYAYQNTPHLDRAKDNTTTQQAPDVVIAMRVTTKVRPEAKAGFYDHVTTGSGDAWIFQNGTVTKAIWKRDGVADELKFYDGDNNIIALNRGQTWISMFASSVGGNVSWDK